MVSEMNFEKELTQSDLLVVDLSTEDKRLTDRNSPNIRSSHDLAVISAKNVVITVNSVLSLNGVTIPRQGEGYLTVWVELSQEGGDYRNKVEINALDLTPAGTGTHTARKVLQNIPPGRYRAYCDVMSYWKHDGRFTYSTYAVIEGDGERKWGYQLIATPGQENPKYDSATVIIDVTG